MYVTACQRQCGRQKIRFLMQNQEQNEESETDIKVYQQKLRESEKATDDLNAKLAKKETAIRPFEWSQSIAASKVVLQPVLRPHFHFLRLYL